MCNNEIKEKSLTTEEFIQELSHSIANMLEENNFKTEVYLDVNKKIIPCKQKGH